MPQSGIVSLFQTPWASAIPRTAGSGEVCFVQAVAVVSLDTALCEILPCSIETAGRISRFALDKRYPCNAIVVRQGEETNFAFLVADGRAHALARGVDGQVVLLQEFARGDFFGTLADSAAQPESADIIAAEALRTAAFRVLDFLRLADSYQCVSRALVRTLLKQLRATNCKMAERTILSASGRVHAELLRMARTNEGFAIRPIPVITQLAIRVHSTRETVSRTISALERRGIIRRETDALVVVAPRHLEELIV